MGQASGLFSCRTWPASTPEPGRHSARRGGVSAWRWEEAVHLPFSLDALSSAELLRREASARVQAQVQASGWLVAQTRHSSSIPTGKTAGHLPLWTWMDHRPNLGLCRAESECAHALPKRREGFPGRGVNRRGGVAWRGARLCRAPSFGAATPHQTMAGPYVTTCLVLPRCTHV